MKKIFSETLKEMRQAAGYTQKQVYEKLGVPQSTFSSWEVGKAEPSADVLLRLCEIYGVTDILSAFGYDGYNDDDSIHLNIKERDIIEKYRFISEHSSEGTETIDYILNREYKIANTLNALEEKEYVRSIEKSVDEEIETIREEYKNMRALSNE